MGVHSETVSLTNGNATLPFDPADIKYNPHNSKMIDPSKQYPKCYEQFMTTYGMWKMYQKRDDLDDPTYVDEDYVKKICEYQAENKGLFAWDYDQIITIGGWKRSYVIHHSNNILEDVIGMAMCIAFRFILWWHFIYPAMMLQEYAFEKFYHISDKQIYENFWIMTEYWFPIPFLMKAFYDIAVVISKTALPLQIE